MKKIRDGDLYKVLTVFGEKFELYYGYYDERDRYGKYAEPLPIYPDFTREPRYTEDGYPFATEMQDVCIHYLGREGEEGCYACAHFERGEDMIGLCRCKERLRE